jgi:hypothetical protein
LCGADGGPWVAAADDKASPILAVHQVGVADSWSNPANALLDNYGVTATGAVLVRPDGFVAWRAKEAVAQPAQTLASVLDRVLSTPVVRAS